MDDFGTKIDYCDWDVSDQAIWFFYGDPLAVDFYA